MFRSRRELGDEGFNQIAAGFFERLGAAEIRGIGLHETRIEIVLADQETELIAQSGLAIVRAICAVRPARLRRGSE